MNNFYHKKRFTPLALSVLFSSIIILGFTFNAKADVTVAAVTTIDASATSITNGSGVLTINGTLNLLLSNVSLLGYTSVIINGPSGQINWGNKNYDLTFAAGTSIIINNPTSSNSTTSFGLQPVSGSASQKLIIGNTVISVSNDNSSNAAFSFAQFNTLGGLPKFTITSNSPVCSGSVLSLTITPDKTSTVAYTYNWSITPSSGTFTNNNTSSTTSGSTSITPSANNYIITCSVSATGDPLSTNSINVSVLASGIWLGTSSTNWTNTANWCGGTIPTSSTDVTIPIGRLNYPNITSTVFVRNLTVAIGGSALVTVSSSGTLKIAGTLASTNGINSTAGTIVLNGTVAQTLSGNNFVSNSVANLTDSNAAGISISSGGGILTVSGAVSFGNVNSAVLTTNDNLTLLSSATATARIADLTNNSVNSGNNISGKVVVERFIPGKRAWRLLSAPITKGSNVSISASWQEGSRAATVNSVSDPNPGYGTHITYGTTATNGYDQGINGNTSIRYLNTTGWNGVPTGTNNTATTNAGNVADQPGYFVFVRGDRSTLLSSGTGASFSSTILRVKGNLNIGANDLTLGTTFTVGSSNFRVISNPYASAINFNKIINNSANSIAGFLNNFYLWDPNITGSKGVGGWVALSYNNGVYEKSVVFPNSDVSSLGASGDIQSGTAFVINYSGSATKIAMLESNKSTSSDNKQFRPSNRNQQLRLSLLAKNEDNTISINDGALVLFDSLYSNTNDGMDMGKMPNFAENFGILNNGELLAIERRQALNKFDTIAFSMSQMKLKNYQLEFMMNDITVPDGTAVFLEDLFLQKKSPVNLKDITRYDFSITSNSSTSVADRFRLIFRPSVEYVTFKGNLIENDIAVDWKIANELNVNRYEIERSNESKVFSTIGSLNSKGDNPAATDYKWVDVNSAAGNYFYRIKSISNNGVVAYSKLVNVKVPNRTTGIFVINNPITDNTIKLQINDSKKGLYNVKLLNNAGQYITAKTINYLGGSNTVSIESSQNLLSGNYQLQVTGPQNKLAAIKVIVQK